LSYVSFKVTTKQKPRVETQKIKKKESKHITTKNHQITKKTVIEGKRNKDSTKQIENNEQNDNSKSVPVNNYLECKWTKFFNPMAKSLLIGECSCW
jgi:hypothetical protein